MAIQKMPKKKYYTIMISMYAALLFIAWSINVFVNKKYVFEFVSKYPWYLQLLAGLTAGAILGFIGASIVLKDKYFASMKELITGLFDTFDFTIIDIVVLCLLAGTIEEILFRGVVQAMAGIWTTSFIFIFIHGYFNLKDKNMTVFGAIMFFLSVGIGYSYEYAGMITAMAFHFMFDFIVLLMFYKYLKGREKNGE